MRRILDVTNLFRSVQYIIQALLKMQTEQIKTLDVRKAMQIHFNEYAQNVHQDLVWTGQCNSWCKFSTLP